MKLLAIIQLTFWESFARKIFLGFLGISTLICMLFIFAVNLDIVDGAYSAITIFGNQNATQFSLDQIVLKIQSVISVMLFTAGIFLALFASGNLIPSMLQPGFVDLFISKPVSRFEIIVGRILGVLTVVFFNLVYLVVFFWLIISIKSGIWNPGFLVSSIVIAIAFTALFSVMTLTGILSQSGPLSLMVTYFIIFLSPFLLQRNEIYALLSGKFYAYLLDGLYYFLPKTAELAMMTEKFVSGKPVESYMPIWSTMIFTAFIFIISAEIFRRKNF